MKTTDKEGNPREVHFVDGYTFHDGRWFAYSDADFSSPSLSFAQESVHESSEHDWTDNPI